MSFATELILFIQSSSSSKNHLRSPLVNLTLGGSGPEESLWEGEEDHWVSLKVSIFSGPSTFPSAHGPFLGFSLSERTWIDSYWQMGRAESLNLICAHVHANRIKRNYKVVRLILKQT